MMPRMLVPSSETTRAPTSSSRMRRMASATVTSGLTMQTSSFPLAHSAATLPATIDATVIRPLTTFQKIIIKASFGELTSGRDISGLHTSPTSSAYSPIVHGEAVVAMARKKRPFDVKVFLNTVAEGRTISKYQKGKKVFSQGDPGDAVFYIQEGR